MNADGLIARHACLKILQGILTQVLSPSQPSEGVQTAEYWSQVASHVELFGIHIYDVFV